MTTTDIDVITTAVPPPRRPTSPLRELFGNASARARDLVLPAMRVAFEELDPRIGLVCAYHEGWVDPEGNVRDGDCGKLLRPTLALAVAEAVGGTATAAVPAAVSVETVHAFSLIHDDIMDGDETRRHRATAWKAFGVPMAILAGDALLGLSLSVLLDAPPDRALRAIRRIAHDTQRLIAGQRADLAFEVRDDVTLDDYITMATGKTGALISASCALGAELAGADAATVDVFARCGERLGLAFQIVDDMLGIWGNAGTTGKPVLSDLRSRKKTYPVVSALNGSGPAARRLRELYLGTGLLPEDDVVEAAHLVEEAGGRERAHRAVARCAAEVTEALDRVDLPRRQHDTLLAIVAGMTDRVC